MTTTQLCSKGCGRPAQRRGWCAAHYQQRRTRDTAYGRWESVYTDAEPVRSHVQRLRAAGMGTRRIGEASGTNRSQLSALLNGRADRGTPPSRRIHRDVAAKLLAVPVPDAPHRGLADGTRVPPIGTTRRLQALVAFGYSQAYLCSRLAITPPNSTALFAGTRDVTAATARRVEALFAELQLTPGPNQSARTRGQRRGWPPPMAWDEDTIDHPDAQPATHTAEKVPFPERWAELQDMGLDWRDSAEKLGITLEALAKRLERASLPVPAPLYTEIDKARKARKARKALAS